MESASQQGVTLAAAGVWKHGFLRTHEVYDFFFSIFSLGKVAWTAAKYRQRSRLTFFDHKGGRRVLRLYIYIVYFSFPCPRTHGMMNQILGGGKGEIILGTVHRVICGVIGYDGAGLVFLGNELGSESQTW